MPQPRSERNEGLTGQIQRQLCGHPVTNCRRQATMQLAQHAWRSDEHHCFRIPRIEHLAQRFRDRAKPCLHRVKSGVLSWFISMPQPGSSVDDSARTVTDQIPVVTARERVSEIHDLRQRARCNGSLEHPESSTIGDEDVNHGELLLVYVKTV